MAAGNPNPDVDPSKAEYAGKKAKKRKHQDKGTEGKASGTDNYGRGGPSAATNVPGKRSGTDHLPDGKNGPQAVKQDAGPNASQPTQVDGANGKPKPDAAAAGAQAPGKAGKNKAAKPPPAAPKPDAAPGKAPKSPPVQAGHDISAPVITDSPPVQGKPVAAPLLDVVPDVAPAEPVTVPAPIGRVDPTHDQLRAEVASLGALIKANSDEILAVGASLRKQVESTLEGHAAAIDAKVTLGSKRVVDAYDGIGKGVTEASTKARAELTKREESIPQVIKQARDKKVAEFELIIKTSKEAVKANVSSPAKVAAAHKIGIDFAQKADQKRAALNDLLLEKAGPSSKLAMELDPKKFSAKELAGPAARAEGVKALSVDKQFAVLKKEVRTSIDESLGKFADDYRANGQNVIKESLAGAEAELQPTLDVRKKEYDKSLDAAATAQTAMLKKQIADTRAGIDKTTKQATDRIAAERKPAEDGAKRAGQKLSENIKNGGKEIANQIAKKAATDAGSYNKALEQLRTFANAKSLDPATKAKLDTLKEQLTRAHEDNKKALEQLATTGIAEMKSSKERDYEQAIAGYETAANKTKTELVAAVGNATGDLGAAFDGIGKEFDTAVTAETAKVRASLGEFAQQCNALPDGYTKRLGDKLESIELVLKTQIETAFTDERIKEGLIAKAEPEIKKSIKKGPKDAQELWKAMDGMGTDENAIFSVLRSASPGEIVFIEGCYNDHYDNHATSKYKSPLRADLDDELGGSEWDIAFAYLNHEREKAIKAELDNSRGLFNDEEDRIEQVLRSASDEEIKAIMSSDDGKEAVRKAKKALGGEDRDVVEALTDVNNLADRKIKADAIRLYDAMHGGTGIGTDEAKVKAILEACTDDRERAKLRAYYDTYYAKKELAFLKPEQQERVKASAENGSFLDQSLEDEFSSGERTYVRALSAEKRDQKAVAMAKLIDGAAGGGTDENKMFEALDDEEHRKKFELVKAIPDPTKREQEMNKLLNAREDELNAKLAGLSSKAAFFEGDGVQKIIADDMGTCQITYQELLDLRWSRNERLKRANPGGEIDRGLARLLAKRNLEAMVAQRKLAAGFAEPELMLMYACHGDGTDEEWCKKALSKDGEPLPQSQVAAIKTKFKEVWGEHEALAPDKNEFETEQEPKTGLLASELDGKDWFEVRVLLMGKPETPKQIGYVDNVRYAFVTSGSLAQRKGPDGKPMETSDWSRARADMDHSHKKLQDAVAEAERSGKTLADFNNQAQDGAAGADGKRSSLDGNRLEILAEYSQQSEEAFLAAMESLADIFITIIELIGAALVTVVSMGAASPFLAAFIGNLIVSGLTIYMRKDMVGDAIGTDQIIIDSAKAVVMAALQAAPEARVVQKFTQKIGTQIAGKFIVNMEKAAEQGGARIIGTSWGIGEKGVKRAVSVATAGAKAVGTTIVNETASFLMDEKTYDMKFGEALWGEHSLGARLAKGVPQALVRATVQDLISDISGVSNLRHRGNITGIGKHALYSALAEMGGETAGFFVYLDNYADAGALWEQLLRTNIRAGISGTLQGVAMHRGRAKQLGRDFVNAHLDNDPAAMAETLQHLHDATKYMGPDEMQRLADFVAKEKPDLVPQLPEALKQLAGKTAAPPAGDNAGTGTGAPPTKPAQARIDEARKADADQVDTDADRAPVPVKKDDPPAKTPVVDDEQTRRQRAHEDEQAKKRAKQSVDEDEAKKQQKAKDEEKKKAGLPTDEEQQKKPDATDEARPTKPPADKHAPTDEQKHRGHPGVEAHSHFIGNVPDENMKAVVGASAGPVKNQHSEWEPLLREIAKLDKVNPELAHDRGQGRGKRGDDGTIKRRGSAGDAIEQARTAVSEIARQKSEIERIKAKQGKYATMTDADRDAEIARRVVIIDEKARTAVQKALAATDETDFNSSYEIRDELIKLHYGNEDRTAVLKGESGKVTNLDLEDPTALKKHFEGREAVEKMIDRAAELRRLQRNGEELSPAHQKELDGLKKQIDEQFAYDHYAKETVRRLAEDNIKYTEQSNSAKKLDTRFDKDQLAAIKKQLIAEEHVKLKAAKTDAEREAIQKRIKQLEDLQIAHLAMVHTGFFGERDEHLGTADEFKKDDPKKDRKDRKSGQDENDWQAALGQVVRQAKERPDTAGVDIAGMEHFRFDEIGQKRMEELARKLIDVGTAEQPIVLRPHVGEGAGDIKPGQSTQLDHNTQKSKDGKEPSHYDRGRSNVDKMLDVFEKIAGDYGGRLPPNIIVRFGHVTHASPEAAFRMAKLGIIAEVNLTSNVKTRAVTQNPDGHPPPAKGQPKPNLPERLEDHSLPTLILAGTPIILSTDSHEVMGTNLPTEYTKAQDQIDKVRNNQQDIRVPVKMAEERGWDVHPGPPPHGVAKYFQLDDTEKKRFDEAYDKLYKDANKYYENRPKQEAGRKLDPGDDGSQTPRPPRPPDQPPPPDPEVANKAAEKAKLDEQGNQISRLKQELASKDDAVKARAESELARLRADPEWERALKLNELFDIGHMHIKKLGSDEERRKASEALSKDIPGVMAELERRKQGANPDLQRKRDDFERAVAMEILNNGNVRKAVDDELKRLCDKAHDYIVKTRTTPDAQAETLAMMHTDASKGYGGGLRTNDMADQAKAGNFGPSQALMLKVLKEGNIRERMLALQEFANIIGKDALSEDGRAKITAAGDASGDRNKYSAADAEKLTKRAKDFLAEQTDTTQHKAVNMFKPLADEQGSGKHGEYAAAKASRDADNNEMDTKLPPMVQRKVDEYLGRTLAADPNLLSAGAENHPLARTTITVREALQRGLQLSEREIDAAGGLDGQLNWVVGSKANIVNDNLPFIQNAKQNSMPLKAGISGTTYRWMMIADMLGADPKLARLAAIASLQAADAHSFHEIAVAAKGFGVDYNSADPYANMAAFGLDEATLRRLAKQAGTSIEELNGKAPSDTPDR